MEELQSRLNLIANDNPSESDIRALERLDVDMHFAIVESLPNVRMTGIIKSLNEMMQIVREQDMRLRHAELHAKYRAHSRGPRRPGWRPGGEPHAPAHIRFQWLTQKSCLVDCPRDV